MSQTEAPARLQRYLSEYGRRYPDCWKQIESFRLSSGKSLPAWCWCKWLDIFDMLSPKPVLMPTPGLTVRKKEISQKASLESSRLLALASWRMTHGIYCFDPDLFTELLSTPIEGDLPFEILLRLPEWCVYLEVPSALGPEIGFKGWFVCFDYDERRNCPVIIITIDNDTYLSSFRLPLTHTSLTACIQHLNHDVAALCEDNAAYSPDSVDPAIAGVFTSMVSVLLYLCTVAVDIRDRCGLKALPANPTPRKVKGGLRTFAASGPTEWEVGFRIGAALRAAYQEESERTGCGGNGGEHAAPRPHIRRAHWHSFWTGPKAQPEKRKLTLKWLPPIPVNLNLGDIIPTIHEVSCVTHE